MKKPATDEDINRFLSQIETKLPEGFLEFYKQSNGQIIDNALGYKHIWSLSEIIELNQDYNVDEFAPEMFIFGSDGADTAFAIERITGKIYTMPFIGMSKAEAKFIDKSFDKFLRSTRE